MHGKALTNDFPLEFNAEKYTNRYSDLSRFTPESARIHFEIYGQSEGRAGGDIGTRAEFLDLIPKDEPVLEIGPFLQPCLRRPRHQVEYMDVMDRDGLIQRAREHIHNGNFLAEDFEPLIEIAPHIDHVHPTGDLSIISKKFQFVLSSHCIEHQPNLIKHIKDVENLLLPNGIYFIIIPDKRYCFDHYLPETRTIDVIASHLEGRRVHSPAWSWNIAWRQLITIRFDTGQATTARNCGRDTNASSPN